MIGPYTLLAPHNGWPYYGRTFGFWVPGRYNYPLLFGNGYRYGYGYGYGYGSDPDYLYDYGSPYSEPYEYAPDPFDRSGPTGGLRIRVEPPDADVYVDGSYAGIVDDFNGHFQRLKLTSGPHRVEIRGAGYLPLVFVVNIEPGRTIEYRNRLQR